MERNETTNTRARTVRRYIIPGCLNVSNFCWATITSFGGAGFFLGGLSSFVQRNLLPFTFDFRNIVFFPQGLVMVFYGSVGLLFGLYTWFTIYWRIGSGFNEIDPYRDQVRIFRWGFPGKNRRIDLSYPIKDIQAIRVDIQDGLTPKRAIYLVVKDLGAIPLLRVTVPCPVEEVELQAAELARILQVSLETTNR